MAQQRRRTGKPRGGMRGAVVTYIARPGGRHGTVVQPTRYGCDRWGKVLVLRTSMVRLWQEADGRLERTGAGARGSWRVRARTCRMETGNAGLGMDVIHSLKSGSVLSGRTVSQIFSKEVIQEGARWQFWSSTQLVGRGCRQGEVHGRPRKSVKQAGRWAGRQAGRGERWRRVDGTPYALWPHQVGA